MKALQQFPTDLRTEISIQVCGGLASACDSSSQAIKHPPNLDKPALLAFLSSMLPLPTRHLYLLFPLSAMEPSQHHSPFIIVVKYT